MIDFHYACIKYNVQETYVVYKETKEDVNSLSGNKYQQECKGTKFE